jgi:hypothetical protein
MGIHGSATCVMRYEAATGWLIGEPNRGLSAMFVMMNAARLHVGLQGLGHLEMAAQNARRYAAERVQMRAARRPEGAPSAPADPIAWHPAMRRTLRDLQALSEGLRVVAYRAAMVIDVLEQHPEAHRRAAAASEAALLTPVVKAFCTQQGFDGASAALQVFGGYGFLRDYGIEQTLRDVRIAAIYEGTNQIQAIDLLVRKVLGPSGAAFEVWLDVLADDASGDASAEAGADAGDCVQIAAALRQQIAFAHEALTALRAGAARDAEAPFRVADDFLAGVGHLLLAWAWCVSARAARHAADRGGDAAWLAERISLARHGAEWILPQAAVHWQRVRSMAALGAVPVCGAGGAACAAGLTCRCGIPASASAGCTPVRRAASAAARAAVPTAGAGVRPRPSAGAGRGEGLVAS